MHYYYDGFIWKIRHKENQQYLDLRAPRAAADQAAPSWWDTFRGRPALATLARHALYFGLPLALAAVAIGLVQREPLRNPHGRLPRIAALKKRGQVEQSVREAQVVMAAMEAQLAVERHMLALRPTPAHYAYSADLIYLKGLVKATFVEGHQPGDPGVIDEDRRREIIRAIQAMEQALSLPGRLANRGDQQMTVESAYARLVHWRRELGLGPPGSPIDE
jgi:hypothetical protein